MDKIFKLWVTHSLILDSVLGISSSCSFVLQADDGLCWIDTNCEKEETEYTKIRAVLKQEALRSEASLILTGDTKALCCCYCSVAESLCDRTLWSHGLQHARRLCPPLFLTVCSNSCPLSWWCHATISSSAASFILCLQPFPASGSFPMSQLFAKGG